MSHFRKMGLCKLLGIAESALSDGDVVTSRSDEVIPINWDWIEDESSCSRQKIDELNITFRYNSASNKNQRAA